MSANDSSALRRFLNQNTSRDGEPEFKIRPRPPRHSRSESHVLTGFKRVMQIFCSTTRGAASGTQPARSFTGSQRCAVRVSYSPNKTRGQWRAHGRYLQRDSAVGENKSFNAAETGMSLEEKLAEWQAAGDHRLFKLILSPEFGHRLDLQGFTCDFMRGIEERVGAKLEWVAVVHNNTEHPHVHIALRGVADGQGLRLDRELIRSGMREHAEHLCTLALGYRTEQDVLEAQRNEVGFARATSLDRQIERRAVPVSPSELRVDLPSSNREFFQFLASRMATLGRMGLARPAGSGWTVRSDFLRVLKSMQQAGDRQKMLNQYGILLSDPRLPTQITRPKDITYLEGRVLAHIHDDATGAPHMILEGTDARVHFIRHNATMEEMRRGGALQPNHFVSIRRQGDGADSALVVEDFGDADRYLSSPRMRQAVDRLIQRGIVVDEIEYSGWLGRYRRALSQPPARPAAIEPTLHRKPAGRTR